MGQIEDLKLFVSVVEHGSITKAATTLGIAKSAVSRRLAQLEAHFDVTLVDRQPGNWGVSDAGRELYQRSLPILADTEDLTADFTHARQALHGPLKVTIARELGMSFLQPMLLRFRQDHPEIGLTCDFDDRTIDLERENYDLAIRVSDPAAAGPSALHLGTTRHGLYASPDYLQQHGTPRSPEDLTDHALLHRGADRRPTWHFDYAGKPVNLTFKPALNSNTGAFLKQAAIDGHGIIRLPDFVVQEAAAAGLLRPVLPNADFTPFSIQLIHAPNRRLNKRMRAFVAATQAQCTVFRNS